MNTQDQSNSVVDSNDQNSGNFTGNDGRHSEVKSRGIDKLVALANLLRSAPRASRRSHAARERVRERLFERLDNEE